MPREEVFIRGKAKIAIALDAEFIGDLDRLVEENYFQIAARQFVTPCVKDWCERSAVGYLWNV